MSEKGLEERIQRLELEIERAHAVTHCQNLMSKYQIYHMIGERTEETHLFALETPGGAVEMDWGVYDEPEGILRWKKMEGYGQPKKAGTFPLHGITTPVIEVAGDGKTAKGLWVMIGYESGPGRAYWAAARMAMDFIKEDSEWKIWRYNVNGLIYSPFDKGWHIENEHPASQIPDEYKADRPCTHRFMWKADRIMDNIPPVPLPYETWDDSLACIPLPEKK